MVGTLPPDTSAKSLNDHRNIPRAPRICSAVIIYWEFTVVPNGIDKNIVNFCKNKDNKIVVALDEEPPVVNRDCEECFAESGLIEPIEDLLGEFDGLAQFVITKDVEGEAFIGEAFIITPQTNTIEQLCAQIENAEEETGIPLSDELIRLVLLIILGEDFQSEIDVLIECLLEKGLIVHRESDISQTSLSDNGIDNEFHGLKDNLKVDCSGDPICNEINSNQNNLNIEQQTVQQQNTGKSNKQLDQLQKLQIPSQILNN